jgi:transposase InsO family protein
MAPPELMATGPNELWSWDITKLRGASKGICYYLYVILDVFSRYVVGWTLQTCEKQAILPGRLTVHADRGSAMTTPEATHYGSAPRVLEKRADVLKAACAAHPERFVRTSPVPLPLPTAVWINPPLKSGIVNNGAQ